MTISVREKSTNNLGVLIWLSNDGIGVKTVAHESAHYVCNVFDLFIKLLGKYMLFVSKCNNIECG